MDLGPPDAGGERPALPEGLRSGLLLSLGSWRRMALASGTTSGPGQIEVGDVIAWRFRKRWQRPDDAIAAGLGDDLTGEPAQP